jgi:hypothetical protein
MKDYKLKQRNLRASHTLLRMFFLFPFARARLGREEQNAALARARPTLLFRPEEKAARRK